MGRDTFARVALAHIPKILTLMDRNAHSPTYGCFDRSFWHYKIIDFAARSAHPNGSCDDYFPFERAAGAAAFSLLACLESYQLMELDNPALLRFFELRADWLAGHQESGRLANHVALIALSLTRLGSVLETDRWDVDRDRLVDRLLSWQDDEGWFAEYEGFDPGYHTMTISCLARLHQLLPQSDPTAAPDDADHRQGRCALYVFAHFPMGGRGVDGNRRARGQPGHDRADGVDDILEAQDPVTRQHRHAARRSDPAHPRGGRPQHGSAVQDGEPGQGLLHSRSR